jgi:mycothione reductase
MKHYDIIIIWPGGGTKLRPLTQQWKSIAIIEKAELWGTCLNRGCIPSKMLIYPSDLATTAREHAAELHVHGLEKPTIDFKALVEETQKRISADSNSIEPFYNSHENITLYKGHAKFLENKIIEVNGEKISGDTIYIATGSVPSIPPIEWLEGTPFMTSKEALANSDLPKKMIVIGGWYIAVELGHVYGAAGCDVNFLVRSGMIKAEDKDIREEFEKDFANRYNVHYGVSPIKVEYKNKTFYVTLDNREVMEADSLFVATW